MATTIEEICKFYNYPIQIIKSPLMTEDQLQAAQVKWFDEAYPEHRQMLFAVPNGGERDKRAAAIMQATGVKRGVADLILVLYGSVIFIENKVGDNVQSDDQTSFQRRVEERRHIYILLRTLEEFKELMEKLLGKSKYV